MQSSSTIRLLNQKQSAEFDEDLMQGPDYKFSTYQLMELAGLSVAQATYDYIQSSIAEGEKRKILVVCGPGNNGGDGLIAARHLKMFGVDSDIFYPKQPKGQVYECLVKQAVGMKLQFLKELQEPLSDKYFLFLDAIFGYSFKGTQIRQPFKNIIEQVKKSGLPVVSIDLPSAWDPEKGNTLDSFDPEVVVSMAIPKICSKYYKGLHYLGARFVPPQVINEIRGLVEKYELNLPKFPGSSQFVKL